MEPLSWQLTGHLRKQNVFDQLCYSIQYNRSLNVQQRDALLLLPLLLNCVCTAAAAAAASTQVCRWGEWPTRLLDGGGNRITIKGSSIINKIGKPQPRRLEPTFSSFSFGYPHRFYSLVPLLNKLQCN